MKKLIAVLAVMFSVNAMAWTGNGNKRLEEAREYMRDAAGGQNINYREVAWWVGTVAGLSSVYNESAYKYSICYPDGATAGQLAEIAAQYVIDHPEKRTSSINLLVWSAHTEAFGLKNSACWDYVATE